MAYGAKGTGKAVSFTGGCQCGAVRYTVAADKLVGYTCHCRECQKQSASAFGMSVPALVTAFEITGKTESWGRPTDSGSYTDCHFCTSCGTRLYHAGRNRPGMITIKGGSFDNTEALTIVAHIWVASKVPWLKLSDDLPQWKEQPQSMEEWGSLLGWPT